jgi:hypothetical protein
VHSLCFAVAFQVVKMCPCPFLVSNCAPPLTLHHLNFCSLCSVVSMVIFSLSSLPHPHLPQPPKPLSPLAQRHEVGPLIIPFYYSFLFSLILESVFPSAFSNEFILLWANNNNNNNKTLLLHLQSRMISFETNIDYCVGIFISGARNGRWLLSIKSRLAFRQQGVWGPSYALGENGPG